MNKPTSSAVLAVALAALMLTGALAGTAVASDQTPQPAAEPAQNPYIEADVTKATHNMSDFGTGPQGVLKYYDNENDPATLPAELDDESANPVTYTPSHVSAADFGSFPHDDSSVSVMNSSRWSVTGQNSSKLAVSDDNLAGEVDAINFGTDGSMASGDTATATFDDFEITSDEGKRVLAIGGDINTLDSGTVVSIRVVDEDGDYKEITANSSEDATTDAVWASSTGDSKISQVRLADLATQGSGDGDFNNIQKVEVVVEDGDFDGTLSIVNADRMSYYDFGDEMYDKDGDGEKEETRELTQPNGAVSVTGLDTLGDTFDSAAIQNLQFTAHFTADEAAADDRAAHSSSAEDYQDYEHIGNEYYRLKLVTAYDLSYSNTALKDDVSSPSTRYKTVRYALNTGDTGFDNMSDDNTDWTSEVTSQYSSKGETVTLATGINPGENLIFHSEKLYTDSEWQLVLNGPETTESADDSGSVGPFGSGGDGLLDAILGPIGGMIAAVLGFFGIKKRRSG